MPRYAPQMTQANLQQKLVDLALENDYVEQYDDNFDPANPDMRKIIDMLLSEELLGTVESDWSKIKFDTENITVQAQKTTPDGIPYLEIMAGGDWETPLLCILYFDGKKFRGYVPKNGNCYNHQKKSAFGNNDSDEADFAKQFSTTKGIQDGYIEQDPDIDLVTKEINSRLEAKGIFQYIKGSVVSKAKKKAQTQAKIEKSIDLSGDITPDMVYAVISLAGGGSYVEFELRASRRGLTIDEANRLLGVPAGLRKSEWPDSNYTLWYAPMNCYPTELQKILEAAGFVKAPDNDISHYAGAKTIYL